MYVSGSDDVLRQWSSRGARSTATEIRTSNSRLNWRALEGMLGYLQNLEVFVFIKDSRIKMKSDCSIPNLVHVLTESARNSLKEIVLGASESDSPTDVYGMQDLNSFTNLQKNPS